MSRLEARPLLSLLLISLAVPAYFLLLGYFGDDYGFHLSSWIGMVEGWHAGVLVPAWLAPVNFGLGEPRFYFYPPISLFCGALLFSTFPARLVPGLMPWLAVLVSGLAMLKLARHIGTARATQSALLYCTSFYMVITIVMRYAIAEAFVAAVLPLIVLYALRLLHSDGPLLSAPLPLLLAFAWLTNIPAALVVFYVLLIAFLVLSAIQRSPRALLLYLLAQALAVGLSGWYLVPAALAQGQLTTTGLTSKFPWRAYTLFQHPHNPLARSLTYPLWLWAIAGFLFACSIAWRRLASKGTPDMSRLDASSHFLVALGCIPFLFELPQSGLLWNHLPELKLVAFSFRFLPFVAIALSLLLPNLRAAAWRRIAYTLWILWMLLPVAERIGRYRVHGAPPTFASTVAEIERGGGGMGEYLPAGLTAVPESDADAAASASSCATTQLRWTPQDRQVESHSLQPCLYQPGLFFFPEWHIAVDGRPIAIQRSPSGHLQAQLPAGDHRIEVFFQRPRRPLLLGVALTLLALVLLLASSRRLAGNLSARQP